MTLIRITMIAAFILGSGCELLDDDPLGTDELTEATGMEEPMSHPGDELATVVGVASAAESDLVGLEQAGLEQADIDELVTEEAWGEEPLDEKSHKRTCTFCSGSECFSETHPQEAKARERALEECLRERSRPARCRFIGCFSSH